jgi:hypothetical protein
MSINKPPNRTSRVIDDETLRPQNVGAENGGARPGGRQTGKNRQIGEVRAAMGQSNGP